MSKKKRVSFIVIAVILVIPFFIPETLQIPVRNATSADWNHDTFWYKPWGLSGVHKGIDIFGGKGTDVIAPTSGIVLYTGNLSLGGNVVLMLGPKWHLHYLAHLQSINTSALDFVSTRSVIGSLGDSGNARNKPPHVHYSIITIIPYIWRATSETQGWKKIFFLNPHELLTAY